MDYEKEKRDSRRVLACCLPLGCAVFGVAMVVIGVGQAARASKLGRLEELTPEAAASRSGQLVAVRGEPQGVAPLPLDEGAAPGPLLYFVHTRRVERQVRRSDGRTRTETSTRTVAERWVSELRLGSIRVQPAQAEAQGVESIRVQGDDTWRGLRADQAITVVGRLEGDLIAGGDPFVVSPLPLGQVVSKTRSAATALQVIGVLLLLFGTVGGILVKALGLFKKKE